MQVALDFGQTDGLTAVYARLRTLFRAPPFTRREPVAQMVRSMLGARTYDAVSHAAFDRLAAAFPDWEALANTHPAVIQAIIADVTFPEDKARNIGAALRGLKSRAGDYDLDFLRGWPVPSALHWLEQLPGVGRKVAAATLNFSTLRRPALTIDTHILRVLKRLGFAGPRADIAAAYNAVMPSLADWSADELSDLHALLKRLGQTVCTHDVARCRMCPLADLCLQKQA